MRTAAVLVCGLVVAIADLTRAQSMPAMDHLRPSDTAAAAKLTVAETTTVFEQLYQTAFDTPNSWDSEVRARRVALGPSSDGLVVQGTKLLCGGTGNCQTWVFRLVRERWTSLFSDQAPIVSAFGFEDAATSGVRNFVTETHMSAEMTRRTVYAFDGRFYQVHGCYDVRSNGATVNVTPVPCK